MKNKNKLNIEALIKSAWFIDGEKYIKERFDKLIKLEYKDIGFLPDEFEEGKTKIITWTDSDLEGIVLYVPAKARAYMTII
jgi:hypothetical protein